jgi:antitoxin VapB
MKTRCFVAVRAKLFRSGGSQAVRLPKEFRFEGEKDVLIYRVGSRVVLEGRRSAWSAEFLGLAGSARDFPWRIRRARAEPVPELD